MKNEVLHVERNAPISIWCTRLCLLAVICVIGKYWLDQKPTTLTGGFVLGGFVAITAAALVASFIRSTAALFVMIAAVIGIPFIIFLSMDALVLKGAWWEWCIVFPVQVGIPAVWAYYLWKAGRVRSYYSPSVK